MLQGSGLSAVNEEEREDPVNGWDNSNPLVNETLISTQSVPANDVPNEDGTLVSIPDAPVLPVPQAKAKTSSGMKIIILSIALGAASKTMMGMNTFAAQILRESDSAAIPLLAALIGGLGGLGFYRSQAVTGLDGWQKALFHRSRLKSNLDINNENAPLIPENSKPSIRFKTRAGISLGSLAFAMSQAMSVMLAGGGSDLAYTLAATTAISNLLTSPGNMIAFLNQLGWLTPDEIQVLAPKELTQIHVSKLKKTLIFFYATMGAMTNVASATSLFMALSTALYLDPSQPLYYTVPTISTDMMLGTLSSAVAIGMNIDGANKTSHDVAKAGGWKNFLFSGGTIGYLLLIAITNSLPSNYTGILSASATIAFLAKFYGNNDVTTLDTMIQTGKAPKNAIEIGSLAFLGAVFICGLLLQALNKGLAMKDLLKDIGTLILGLCVLIKTGALFVAEKFVSLADSAAKSLSAAQSSLLFNQQSNVSRSGSDPALPPGSPASPRDILARDSPYTP